MSFIAVGGTLIFGGTVTAGTVAAGAALAGTAASLYGQSQQNKANSAANSANQASVDKTNQQEWNNYLMARGINTGGSAAVGSIPSGAAAVNTKLPLWAGVNLPTGPSKWQKVGADYGAPGTLNTAIPVSNATTAATADGSGKSSSEPSTGQKLKNILDPLNVSVGKNKHFWDPVGLFG